VTGNLTRQRQSPPAANERRAPLTSVAYTEKARSRERRGTILLCSEIVAALTALPAPAFAMHISEGILPAPWAILWYALALPFLAWGLRELRMKSEGSSSFKPLVGLVGAAVFIISCMPIPIPTAGTCSHPAGTGLAAILIGPGLTVVVASIALALQALFLAHGGITTLGANIVSMGVAGAYVGYGAYVIARRMGVPWAVAAFLAGLLSDWATYAMTSVELAAALHGGGSFEAMLSLILLAFVPTQIPLGVLEGILCVGALRFVRNRKPELLRFAQARGGMKGAATIFVLAGLIVAGLACPPAHAASWSGVDKTVIEKVAGDAGRPAQESFINTGQGDLLLFVFLAAGIVGGFIAGYNFQVLFPPRRQREEEKKEAQGADHSVSPIWRDAAPQEPRQ
jgi:cobalt/nickel transport system permease protein